MHKRIGVLTSGGDCAGLNAALRAITLRANSLNYEVIGIKNGTTGLLKRPYDCVTLSPAILDHTMLRLGGTILGSTNKDNPLSYPMPDGTFVDKSQEIFEAYHDLNLEALIGIGGDGSMRIMHELCQKGGLNFVGIPKTIDNDVACTETAIGYVTAFDVATEALDRLQPTAASHQRVMVLEVMGRDAGHIALSAGIAGGADVVLIPECTYNLDKICDKIKSINNHGRNFALIVVSEAVKKEDGEPAMISYSTGERYGGIGQYLCQRISEKINAEARVTVLGHVQRGGEPCASDRILASSFGVAAVDLVQEKKYNRMVAWKNCQVVDVPIEEAIAANQAVDLQGSAVRTALGVGIYLGEF
ncbi:MAG TPA: ATP-dependent 6-phosphofructokinase [Alphaproteobacteria bacterium]|nr:ATP-dependent 6-phosphofructokinase [Alphaproteobacteria bacterium]